MGIFAGFLCVICNPDDVVYQTSSTWRFGLSLGDQGRAETAISCRLVVMIYVITRV